MKKRRSLEIERRWFKALLKAYDGPNGATEAFKIANRIFTLKTFREDRFLPERLRKQFAKLEEPQLGRMLLAAAEAGNLSEVATALSKVSARFAAGQIAYDRRHLKFVEAYSEAQAAHNCDVPNFREFCESLQPTSLHPIPDERTIRDILQRLGLPLRASRRGPRKS